MHQPGRMAQPTCIRCWLLIQCVHMRFDKCLRHRNTLRSRQPDELTTLASDRAKSTYIGGRLPVAWCRRSVPSLERWLEYSDITGHYLVVRPHIFRTFLLSLLMLTCLWSLGFFPGHSEHFCRACRLQTLGRS